MVAIYQLFVQKMIRKIITTGKGFTPLFYKDLRIVTNVFGISMFLGQDVSMTRKF